MSKSIRKSGPVVSVTARLSAFSVVLLAFAAVAASAQTAPQLLPYTSKLIAGGGTAVVGINATCPVSGNKSTDAYGDGCLATEILIGNNTAGTTPGARGAVADANGNIFFTDYNAALVRRVDALTGIVTAVAGGGTATAGTSNGVPANTVKLVHPAGIVFAPNGDLYFSDCGNGQVFKVAATGGFITTTGNITLVAGSTAGTYGYGASNATTTVTEAAGNSYLHFPFGLAFDSKGDLFIVDEYTEAILVLNTSTTTNTVNTVSIAPGTIWKIAGSTAAGSAASPNATTYCTNATGNSSGCNYGLYVENVQANGNEFDSTYSVAVDPNGTVYGGDEYYDSVFKVTAAGVMSTFAGVQNSVGVKPTIAKRGAAGSFGIGSVFGVVSDPLGNIYITDASSGVVWRVDAAGSSMYVVAGGASSVCTNATDVYGDGCPALQSTFGHSGTGNYATATLPGPGIYAVSVDAYSDLFVGDTETNLVREVASGTQFGPVGANQPTDIVDIHFAAADSPVSSGAYTLTSGQTNFSLGTATCTTNSDNTTDCLLPVTATPTVLGPFTGTLTVKSQLGGTSNFPLSGTFVTSPLTRTTVTYSTGSTACGSTTTFGTTTSITFTATVASTGSPTGTITFYANGTQIGTPQTVTNSVATLTTTFSTPGSYVVTATYSGDTYFKTSTGKTGSFSTSAPGFTTSILTSQTTAVVAGQTALYSFSIAQNVYTGNITFACSGLPSGATCVFNPTTISAAGCTVNNTVALNIYTTAAKAVGQSAIGSSGRGLWRIVTVVACMMMALTLGLRRRKLRMRQVWLSLALLGVVSGLAACGTRGFTAATPSGTYTVNVTVTGSTGTPSSFTVPLIVQ